MSRARSRGEFIRADLAEVERLLERIPSTSVINRNSYLARKKELERELAELREESVESFSFELTFQGDPVESDRGIVAKFGTEALKRFSDAVSQFAAASSSPLGSRGAVPNEEDYNLMITDVARGSFGFVLEAKWEMKDGTQTSPVVTAVAMIGRLINSAQQDTDEGLADVAAGADPRAVNKLHEFLGLLAAQKATFAFQGDDMSFSCKNRDQVLRTEARLDINNIVERRESLEGEFSGVLPHRGLFEFRKKDSEEFINGRIDERTVDAEMIKDMLDQTTTIEVRSTRAGKGQPRYLLLKVVQPPRLE
ncbi:MAG: hypothetical protein WCK39_08020 [Methanomassiliicoccales archaeon]